MNFDRRLIEAALSAKLDFSLTLAAGFVGGVVVVLQAWLLSRIISDVFVAGATLATVWPLLLSLAALAGLQAGAKWLGEVSAQRVANRVKFDLRRQLLAHLFALGPAYINQEASGELLNTLNGGVAALNAYLRQYLPQLAKAAIIPLTILLVIFPLDWLSGLVLLLTYPLIPLFMVLIGNTASTLNQKQWRQLSRMSAHLLDSVQGLTTLQLFNRSRAQVALIAQISEQFRQRTMAVLRVAFLSALVLELTATISIAVVAVEIGLRLMHGRFDFASALFILILAPEFYAPLRQLGAGFHAGMTGAGAFARIAAILQTELTHPPIETNPAPKPASPPEIAFENVTFSYPGSTIAAVQQVSLRLPARQVTALTGPSGAGKSSLVALLLGFIQPQHGQIMVNGRPLASDAVAWRRQIAWVPQNPYLFHDTVLANLRFSRPTATLAEVERAAQLAHADTFIRQLPDGYDTVIGEQGARLSAGQAQRIALARTFLQDAPLLILDEASAHLDPALLAEVQASLTTLRRGRTVLMIAHRLSTLQQADQIIVLQQGRVLQQGTPATLQRQAGLYRQLLQATAQP